MMYQSISTRYETDQQYSIVDVNESKQYKGSYYIKGKSGFN